MLNKISLENPGDSCLIRHPELDKERLVFKGTNTHYGLRDLHFCVARKYRCSIR